MKRPQIPAAFKTRRAKAASLLLLGAAVIGEQAIFALATSASAHPHHTPTPTTLRGKIQLALSEALGSSDRGVQRFRILAIRSAGSNGKDISVRWSINNDLSAGSIPNGAQVDAYLVFADIYQIHAPIQRVDLTGTYPNSSGREVPVMRLQLGRHVASQVGMYGWGTIDAETLWPLIQRTYVASDFEPTPTE